MHADVIPCNQVTPIINNHTWGGGQTSYLHLSGIKQKDNGGILKTVYTVTVIYCLLFWFVFKHATPFIHTRTYNFNIRLQIVLKDEWPHNKEICSKLIRLK